MILQGLQIASVLVQVLVVALGIRLVARVHARRTALLISALLVAAVSVRVWPLTLSLFSVSTGTATGWALEVLRLGVFAAIGVGLVKAGPRITTLQAERDKAHRYLEVAGTALVGLDVEGRITLLNKAACELLDVEEGEAVGVQWFTIFVEPLDAPAAKAAFEQSLASRDAGLMPAEYHIVDSAGEPKLVAWKRSLIVDDAGGVTGMLCSGDDVTKQRADEEQMHFESFLLDNATDSIIVYELDGRILYANDSACTARGFEREEFLTLESGSWAATEFMQLVSAERDAVIASGRTAFETRHKRRDGSEMHVEVHADLLAYHGRHVIATVVRDISERKRAEATIEGMAFTDQLTGLANRAGLHAHLVAALGSATRASAPAVLFLDLDHFKGVNDTLGHAVGDEVLRTIADRLRDLMRRGDVVSRFGGDEFTILLDGVKSRDALGNVARKVLDIVRAEYVVDGDEICLTATIGAAMWAGSGDTAERMLKAADVALFKAKADGRDRFLLYESAHDAANLERFSLKNDLRAAIDSDQLYLHYQPLVTLPDMTVVGTEALLRWHHPVRGSIPPSVFIPLAEEYGLITRLGEWVLHEACRQNREWQDAGLPHIRVAVNLSPQQLNQPDFDEMVAGVLSETGLDPRWLELEITESMAMKDLDASFRVFERLRSMGVSIAIDDFGTGYSSLSHIRDFPVRTLKVDRSFISSACDDPGSANIARTIIVLAHSLNLNAVAEGVETAEQYEFLAAEGCDEMQGFLYSPAVPPHELVPMLTGDGTRRAG